MITVNPCPYGTHGWFGCARYLECSEATLMNWRSLCLDISRTTGGERRQPFGRYLWFMPWDINVSPLGHSYYF